MKKNLFAILLSLAVVVGMLPTVALAEETGYIDQHFTITKTVEKTETAVAPPAETFEFVLEDTAQEKKPLEHYGITLPDGLQISTDGVGVYEMTANVRIDQTKVNEENDWRGYGDAGSQTNRWYSKTFLLTEKNDGKDGWDYSTQRYAVTFKYTIETGEMTCTLHENGNDVTFRTADFKNTYTKQEQVRKTVEIPFTVTVKQGGNVAPGKQTFELEIFDIGNSDEELYTDVTCTAAVETNGIGDYNAKLAITGPEDQVQDFTCEGFFVREKNTKAANWTYSDAVWYVIPIGDGDRMEYMFYPATLEITDNGEYYVFDGEHPEEKMIFENVYTENKAEEPAKPAEPEKPANPKAPKTGDSSNMITWLILLFASCGAVAGITVRSRKRRA